MADDEADLVHLLPSGCATPICYSRAVATVSTFIETALEDCASAPHTFGLLTLNIPLVKLPAVDSRVLQDILAVCKRYALTRDATNLYEDWLHWQAARPRDEALFVSVLRAANFLEVEPLLECACIQMERKIRQRSGLTSPGQCAFFRRGDCRFGARCRYMHGPNPTLLEEAFSTWLPELRHRLGVCHVDLSDELAFESFQEPHGTAPTEDDTAAHEQADLDVLAYVLNRCSLEQCRQIKAVSLRWRAAARSALVNPSRFASVKEADEQARRVVEKDAEAQAKQEAKAKLKASAQARREAEQKARREAEAARLAKREEEDEARRQAEEAQAKAAKRKEERRARLAKERYGVRASPRP